MGVCLAYPRDKYRLKNVWNENLADTEKWPKREKVERGVVGKVAGWPFQVGGEGRRGRRGRRGGKGVPCINVSYQVLTPSRRRS